MYKDIKFVKFDIDELTPLQTMKLDSIDNMPVPRIRIVKDGEIIKKLEDQRECYQLQERLKKLIAS
jgi:hypothetical protein